MYNWFHSLRTLARELSTEMRIKDNDKLGKILGDVEPLVSEWARNPRMNTEKCYNALNEMEVFLRGILKESGLQMKMKSDPRLSLGKQF